MVVKQEKVGPYISEHFLSRKPSAIRTAQIEFAKRKDGVEAVNTAIGNVSLPIHPAVFERIQQAGNEGYEFDDGVVKYSATVGLPETNEAFLHIIESSGFSREGLYSQITDGGSQAMELIIVGLCGPAGSKERPLMLIDAAYTNYSAMAKRLGRATVSVRRHMEEDGKFSLPSVEEIEQKIVEEQPGALLLIPDDNPTGQYYNQESINRIAELAVKNGVMLVSDEAYRELHYTGEATSSIWGVTEEKVSGITGYRVSIETMSKVWNGCGLRIGALVTDNELFHTKSVAENTASLCSSVIDQWVSGALAHESHEDLRDWYEKQRNYYKSMMEQGRRGLLELNPDLIVSSPDASIYSVIDVRNAAGPGFDAMEFVLWCAREGKVDVGDREMTLLVSPMAGFYSVKPGEKNPGDTQMRVAFVQSPELMKLMPELFVRLLNEYESIR